MPPLLFAVLEQFAAQSQHSADDVFRNYPAECSGNVRYYYVLRNNGEQFFNSGVSGLQQLYAGKILRRLISAPGTVSVPENTSQPTAALFISPMFSAENGAFIHIFISYSEKRGYTAYPLLVSYSATATTAVFFFGFCICLTTQESVKFITK